MKVIITEQQYSNLMTEVRNKPGDRNKIYQDDNIVVVAPLTHTSSCKYGAHTKWCVSVPSNPEHFNEYMRHGVLIYFIIRSPHKNTNKSEYKFAYYYPFDEKMEDEKGWYDMSDNPLSFDDDIDQNLIKFLIPDEIFNLVEDYIKTQRPIWKENVKNLKTELTNKIMNNPKNGENIIVNDANWFIMRVDDGFNEFFENLDYHIYTQQASQMTILYINKKTHDMYSQSFQYYVDIRNKNNDRRSGDNIEDLSKDEFTHKLDNIYKKYYPKIEKQYFKDRKKFFNLQRHDFVYLPAEYVEVGDKVGGHNSYTVTKKYIDPRTNQLIFVGADDRGNINNNLYYNDSVGMGLEYDKERHNPI